MNRRDAVIDNVQALRGVAALMVVFHHIRDYANANIEGAVPTILGSAGVDIFFVISGFVMMLTAGDGRLSPGDFFKRRLIRIVPLYWLFTLLMLALLLAGLHPTGVHGWSWPNVATSLAFLPQRRADGWAGPILPVGWTLNYEMFFYVVFAAGLFYVRGRRLVLWIAAFFSALVALGLVTTAVAPGPRSYAFSFYTDPIQLEFVAGCVLGLVVSRKASLAPRPPRLRAIGFGLLAAGVALLALNTYSDLGAGPWRVVVFGVPAWMIVAGAVCLEKTGLRASSRWVLLAGAASYAVYLCHVFVLQSFEKLSVKLVAQTPVTVALTGLVGAAAVLLTGILVHLWIEMPLVKRLRSSPQPELQRAGFTPPAE